MEQGATLRALPGQYAVTPRGRQFAQLHNGQALLREVVEKVGADKAPSVRRWRLVERLQRRLRLTISRRSERSKGLKNRRSTAVDLIA